MPAFHELQGYAIVLDKICHVTRVFEAHNDEGSQFNVNLMGDTRLQLRFPDHSTAVLERDRLLEALKAA